MGSSLLMCTEAPFSLNFLIYIQNIFLNQKNSKDEYRYPYIPLKNIVFKEEFEFHFKKLWDEVLQRLADNRLNDQKIFYEDKDLFYQSLFVDSAVDLEEYNEIYQSFIVWWGSFAGRFTIERSIDEPSYELYVALVNSLKQKEIVPKKQFNISLIYDECLLGDCEVSSYFAVIPIRDFFIKSKDLLAKLQVSIY